MSGELKPCPFCNGPAVNVAGEYVTCGSPTFLSCAGRSVRADVEDWNRRATPSQRLDAATVEREWSLPDLRDLHTDVQRIRDHDLGNKRMRDLLQATMDTLVAADVEYAALATEPHQHGGKGA